MILTHLLFSRVVPPAQSAEANEPTPMPMPTMNKMTGKTKESHLSVGEGPGAEQEGPTCTKEFVEPGETREIIHATLTIGLILT